jgi:hypothetical protein
MKRGIKSKSSPTGNRATSTERRHPFAHKPKFPSETFSISICLLFALFIIEKCFLVFCRCHCFVIVTAGFNFPCSSRLLLGSFLVVFVSLCSPNIRSPAPDPTPRLISFGKHPHEHFSALNSIHERHSLLLCCWLLCSSRYLNFILMFVPSINFYNPFINLIKNKTQTQSSCCSFRSFAPVTQTRPLVARRSTPCRGRESLRAQKFL